MAAAKKSKKQSFKKRSVAAKKGWATRRKKAGIEGSIAKTKKKVTNARKGITKKRGNEIAKQLKKLGPLGKAKTNPRISPKKKRKTVKELETELAIAQQELKFIEETGGWVDAMPLELIRKDGSIALEPSSARVHPDADTMWRVLKKADKQSKLDIAAQQLALEYNIPIREIYTLYYSP